MPLCASMILFDINNPNPVPVLKLVASLVNNLGIISRSIPLPVSVTETIATASGDIGR